MPEFKIFDWKTLVAIISPYSVVLGREVESDFLTESPELKVQNFLMNHSFPPKWM